MYCVKLILVKIPFMKLGDVGPSVNHYLCDKAYVTFVSFQGNPEMAMMSVHTNDALDELASEPSERTRTKARTWTWNSIGDYS